MKIIKNTDSNYELIDFEKGFKYESIDNIIIKRPDSSAIGSLGNKEFLNDLSAAYHQEAGDGNFDIIKDISDDWVATFKDLRLKVKLTSYKHIGIFPEQSYHWDYVSEKIKESEAPVKVLNLFAYTGAASINAAQAGAEEVVHVEALKQLNTWAKENSVLSGTEDCNIRYMQDDVLTFLRREVKRGNKYQIIIMDPPSFGRGPKNQIWKFQDHIDELMDLCNQVLEDPICVVVSTYTNHFTKHHLKSLLHRHFTEGSVETYELALESKNQKFLKCGTGGIVEF